MDAQQVRADLIMALIDASDVPHPPAKVIADAEVLLAYIRTGCGPQPESASVHSLPVKAPE